MNSFLPVSALAYVFTGGATAIDKILLKKSIPNPLIYVFYINLLGLLALLLIPFGAYIPSTPVIVLASLSGIVFSLALYFMFAALKIAAASVVGPTTGAFTPLFAALIGWVFLNQTLEKSQYLAILILIVGTLILTFNQWFKKLKLDHSLILMVLAGFLFGLSAILLHQAYLQTSFVTGLVFNRVGAGVFALVLLAAPSVRRQIFPKAPTKQSLVTLALLLFGQALGGLSGILLAYGITLASPALVNSVFGVQYVVILAIALLLYQKNPQIMDESLNKGVILQKVLGILVLSFGLYLLA